MEINWPLKRGIQQRLIAYSLQISEKGKENEAEALGRFRGKSTSVHSLGKFSQSIPIAFREVATNFHLSFKFLVTWCQGHSAVITFHNVEGLAFSRLEGQIVIRRDHWW